MTRVEITIDAERLHAIVEEIVHIYRDYRDHSEAAIADYIVARAKAAGSTMTSIDLNELMAHAERGPSGGPYR